jgi:hypothetical protein
MKKLRDAPIQSDMQGIAFNTKLGAGLAAIFEVDPLKHSWSLSKMSFAIQTDRSDVSIIRATIRLQSAPVATTYSWQSKT